METEIDSSAPPWFRNLRSGRFDSGQAFNRRGKIHVIFFPNLQQSVGVSNSLTKGVATAETIPSATARAHYSRLA